MFVFPSGSLNGVDPPRARARSQLLVSSVPLFRWHGKKIVCVELDGYRLTGYVNENLRLRRRVAGLQRPSGIIANLLVNMVKLLNRERHLWTKNLANY